MKNNRPTRSTPLAIILIVIGSASRLVPHVPNFTAVGGIGLFSGARLTGWKAFLMPLLIMAVTEPILAQMLGYPLFTSVTVFVYASLLCNVLIGRFLRNSINAGTVVGGSLLCSIQFYLVTNFGLWLMTSLYPPTAAGLAACYIAGLPYLGSTMAGDLTFSAFLFGAFHLLSRPAEQRPLTVAGDQEG